jgi:cellulose synthase/poly-beta-1,6-N-acetylglucosamine synthase-like glycosyltransferase
VDILDSNVVCEPGFIPSCAGRFREGIACGIGHTGTHWVPKNGWVVFRTFVIWNYQWSLRRSQSVPKAINVTSGSNSVFRADVLAQIDWDECVRYRTEDYRYMVQIHHEKPGACCKVYAHRSFQAGFGWTTPRGCAIPSRPTAGRG